MLRKNLYIVLGGFTVFMSATNFAIAASTQEQLFLKNGDRLTGRIISYNQSTVTIETGFGTLDVDSNNIGGVSSPQYTLGNFTMSDDDFDPSNTLTPLMSNTTDIEASTDIAAKTDTDSTDETNDETGLWGAKWSGNINIGGELETGNSDSKNITIDGKTKANWADIHRLTLSADYEWEKEEDTKVTDEREANVIYDYFFADQWFWNNALMFEQDKIEQLDHRVEMTSGLGYQFYDDEDLSLQITFGPGYEQEKYKNQNAEDSITSNWSLGYEQSFYEDMFRLYHDHDVVTPMDDLSSYFFESDSGVKIPLKKGIVASGEVEFDWNNDPAMGEQEDDTTYSVKLGYEW